MQAIKLYCGMDPREQAGLHVFLESVWKHTSLPVDLTVLTPAIADRYGIKSDGTNAFSTLRFAIPHIQEAGWAIWIDGADCLLRADLAELWELCQGPEAVKVVKHDYQPASDLKYIGTEMEAHNASYPRKNWSSVMGINCGHWAHYKAKAKLLSGDGKYLHRFSWLNDEEIGSLPTVWNWLDEYGPNENAKLVHFTNGTPGFTHYRHAAHADEWRAHLRSAATGLQYLGNLKASDR